MTRPVFAPSEARGFTLIELLVSVGIISLLIGLLVPVLRGVRNRAREQRELITQRDSGMAVFEYTNDHDNLFPGFGKNGTDEVTLLNHVPGQYPTVYDGPGLYWVQHYTWAYYMDGLGYDVKSAFRLNNKLVNYRSESSPQCLDNMTFAAFARPHYFSDDDIRNVEDHILQKITITASPSAKIMLQRFNFNRFELYDDPTDAQINRIPYLHFFIDGHSGKQTPFDLTPPVSVPPLATDGASGLTTLHGLLGRDI